MILVNSLKTHFFLLIFCFLFNSCNYLNNQVIINGTTMGTTYSIKIDNLKHKKSAIKAQIDELLENVNHHFSTYRNNSEISRINSSNSLHIPLSIEFYNLLKKALKFCKLSNGSYDITILPLVKLWGFQNHLKQEIPSSNIINEMIENIGYTKLALKDGFLFKENKNLQIDLNSIAKGYAVDKVYKLLKNLGYASFLIEIGGELRSINNNWIIGIQHPHSDEIIIKIQLNNMSMATSGTYNNNFTYKETTYAHIINPKTGYPYKYKPMGATIIADNSTDADAYATMALTWDSNDFIKLINSIDNVECYIVEVIDNKIIEYNSLLFNNFIVD